jgi:hypothetical protein
MSLTAIHPLSEVGGFSSDSLEFKTFKGGLAFSKPIYGSITPRKV